MKIGIIGTGVVGQSVGGRLVELGHDIVLGTRDPQATLARDEPDRFGNPPLHRWLAQRPTVGLATFADAAAHGVLVVNATNGDASLPALTAAGAENLAGKVLLDIANPLDFSSGFPPSLSIANTDSLAERIQREFPQARVVKALNTMTAYLMVDPKRLAGGDHTVFVSGDDPAAKSDVTDLLRAFGWVDVIDLGDLSTARGTEMFVTLWVRLLPTLGGDGNFNIKVVR